MALDDDEQIDISVVMHDLTSPAAENVDRKIENIEDSARRAGGSVEDLGEKSDDTAKQVDDLGKSTDRASKRLNRFDRMYQRFTGRFRRTNKYISKHREEVDKTSKSYDKARRSGQKFFTFGINFGKMIGLIKLSALIEGLPLVATGLSAVGAGAVAAVSGLSPLVGIVGALGPGMFALGSGIGVVKMATSGLGEAFKVLGDATSTAEEIAAATKNLAPSALQFVKMTLQLKEGWAGVKEEVQQTFFKGLGPALTELNRDAMPMLSRHLVNISGVMNGIALDFFDMIGKKRNLRALNEVLRINSHIIENVGTTLVGLGELGLWMTRAAGPMTRAMSGDFAEWIMGKSASARKNQDRLREFFSDSYDLLKKVIDVTADFAHGLYNVGRASAPLAKSLGKWFTQMGEGFRSWTENEDNFKRMENFFREMRYPLKQFGLLIGAVVEGMLTLAESDDGSLGRIFKRLRTDIVPNLVSALEQAQNGGVIDGILDLGEAFTKLIDSGFVGASAPIVKALGVLANAFADFFGALPEDMRTGIVGLMLLSSTLGRFRIGKIGKLGGGLGIGAALKGLTGKAGIGGAAGKFMGATPVFVVNPGFGGVPGPGGGPKVPPIIAGGPKSLLGKVGPKALGIGAGGLAVGGLLAMFLDGVSKEQAIDAAKDRNSKTTVPQLVDFIRDKQTEIAGLRMAISSGNVPDPGAAQEAVKAAEKDLLALQYRFDALSTMSIPQYQQGLANLPKDVATQISTPGAVDSEEEVEKLLRRLDLTPAEKFIAMSLLGIPTTMADIARVQRELEKIHDKTVQISVNARLTNLDKNLSIGGSGFGLQAPGAWTGAATKAGQMYLTGEQGPEAFVTRGGKIRMLGLHGPEFVKPGAGAVVNADATRDPFGGDPNKSPDWAVTALRRAAGAGARAAAAGAAEGQGGISASVQVGPIYPQTEMDVESAVRRAWSKIEKERRERS